MEFKQYLHRVGRTARAGKSGRSVSLVGESDRKILKLAIKNSNDQVKQRIISSALIQQYKQSIETLSEAIEDILKEEKEEKDVINNNNIIKIILNFFLILKYHLIR